MYILINRKEYVMYVKDMNKKDRRNMRKLKEEFIYGYADVPMPKKDLRAYENIRRREVVKLIKEFN
jgi:hypothetical protein|tara:strand:- start:2930 stop:3127 length:198 start_codon:yes stop_codon:yes gene_type:complete